MAIDTYNTQKHHFEDVENHPFQLEGFGNLGNLLHARRLMERYEPTLPPCPFCGGPSVLRGRWAYCTGSMPRMRVQYKAICKQCPRFESSNQAAGYHRERDFESGHRLVTAHAD